MSRLLALCAILLSSMPASADDLPFGALARFGTLRLRHASKVNALAFSPDGKLLASASGEDGGRDNTVRLWDVATGDQRVCLTGHQGGVYSVAFAPDGKLIASGSHDFTIRLWDVATGQEVRQLERQRGIVTSLAFAPDGKLLASVSMNSNVARLWDVATGREVRQFAADGRELNAVAFTQDGKSLVAGGSSARAQLWDVATGEERQTFGGEHVPRADGLAISPDGKVLATADGEIFLYDVATGKRRKLGGLRTDVDGHRVAFSPDGKWLATTGAHGKVRLWDVRADKVLREFRVNSGWSCLAYSPDGKYLAWSGYGNVVRLWETATGRELHADGTPQGQVGLVGFGLGGTTALVGSQTVRVWDLAPGKDALAPGGRRGVALPGVPCASALSPDGKLLVSGGWSGSPRFFDAATGAEVKPLPVPPTGGAVNCTFTPDSKRLLVLGSDQTTMTLWDLTTGAEVCRFVGHKAPVDAVAFSPDGKLMASSGTNRAWMRGPPPGALEDVFIRIWDTTTGKEVRQLPGKESNLAFSPDGTLLVAASYQWEGGIRLLGAATGAEVRRIEAKGHLPYHVAFSPDGHAIASSSRDGTVRLWEVATGGERRRFEGHNGEVHRIAFSPDGRRLLSGGADTTAFLWDVYAPDRPAPADLAAAVQNLELSDAAAAYRAVCALVAAPERAVPLLAGAVSPAEPIDAKRFERLAADLDAARFAVREQATAELAKLGDVAEPALRQLLAGHPGPEARQRVEQLLEKLKTTSSPALLRGLRAVEVLEAVATPDARRHLERLAGGAAGARLTREARAALDRLGRHSTRHWSPPAAAPPADLEKLLGGPVRGGTDAGGKPLPPGAVARIGKAYVPNQGGARYQPTEDARTAITHQYAPKIQLLELPSGRERHAIDSPNESHWVGEVTQSPDGTRVAADTSHGPGPPFMYVWEWASGRELWRVDTKKHQPTAIRFSPAGDRLATVGFDHTARLWDAASGKELRRWDVGKDYNSPLAFSPDGKLLAVGGSVIRLWDVANGQTVREIGALPRGMGRALAFSPDGELLIADGDERLTVWEVATGRPRHVLEGSAGAFTLAVSADGRSLLSGGGDGLVRLWELATGNQRAQFAAHVNGRWVGAVALARDGRTAASFGGDGFLFVWDLTGLAPDGRLAPATLSDAERDGLWRLLASDDAAVAYRAGWRLTAGGDDSVAFLKTRLSPVPRDPGPHVGRLLTDLAGPSEAARQAATEGLERLGPPAASDLRKALDAAPEGETRDRLEYLLGRAARPTPVGANLQALRAVEVLERIGTPAARAVLVELAGGLPEAALTREAERSVRR